MASVYYVRTGTYNENGFQLKRDLQAISAAEFEQMCAPLEGYLLRLESSSTSSYDNSDDERVEDSYRSSSSCVYREINPKENAQSLLMMDGKIVGVVFVIDKGKSSEYTRAFSFDGTIKQLMILGYGASHSSSYTYVERVSLAKKGNKGVPESAREAKFFQSKLYPSL